MKLRPNDLTEVKRIVGFTPPSPLRPGIHKNMCVLDISDIMGKYGLNSDDKFDCAQRLVQLSPTDIEDHLKVDQRSTTTLLRLGLGAVERLEDDRIQLHFPGERPLEQFAPRVQWKPKDAIEMKRLMTGFYESPFGLWMGNETALRAGMGEGYAHESAVDAHRLWAQEDLLLILAKDSYLDMLEAAAVTAPSGELNHDELLAPSGVLFFERERNIPSLTDDDDAVPIRGMMWNVEDGDLTVQVLIDGHHELNNPGRLEPPADCYAYLYVMNLLKTQLRNPTVPGHESEASTLLGFLRSIKSIAQSPATSNTTAQSKPAPNKKRLKATAGQPRPVRVLSLRNADHGRYELDAATGRKIRQHWVRGHWRNQWYPSLNDNRAIWIDGYIKGDSSRGIVTGQKIHVAR